MGQLFKTCRYPSNIGSPLSLSITARPGSRSHSRLGTCSFCNTCKHGEWPSPDVLWRVVRDADLNFLCIMHTCLYRFGWKGKKSLQFAIKWWQYPARFRYLMTFIDWNWKVGLSVVSTVSLYWSLEGNFKTLLI